MGGGKLVNGKQTVVRFLKKIGLLYIKWSLFYLLLHFCLWYGNDSQTVATYFIGWCKSVIVKASYYHLWYVVSLLYAIVIFYVLAVKIKFKYIPYIAIGLWAIGAFKYGYAVFSI